MGYEGLRIQKYAAILILLCPGQSELWEFYTWLASLDVMSRARILLSMGGGGRCKGERGLEGTNGGITPKAMEVT